MTTTSANKVYGTPDQHLGPCEFYHQGNTNECAIYAQWNILMDYGIGLDEKELVKQAKEHGWFTDEGGTPIEHLGKLLELNGVSCNMVIDANQYNLINELAQGKRVIVTVDSSELWRENTVLSKLWEGVKDVFGSGEDHALVVTGIDTYDPDNIQVVLTDSGTGHRTISYPLDQFVDAWADGGCKMIVTNGPPPRYLHRDSMAHFDYETGHIDKIGNTPFDQWQLQHAGLLEGCSISAIADALGLDAADCTEGANNVQPFGVEDGMFDEYSKSALAAFEMEGSCQDDVIIHADSDELSDCCGDEGCAGVDNVFCGDVEIR